MKIRVKPESVCEAIRRSDTGALSDLACGGNRSTKRKKTRAAKNKAAATRRAEDRIITQEIETRRREAYYELLVERNEHILPFNLHD